MTDPPGLQWSVELELKPLDNEFKNIGRHVDYLNRKFPMSNVDEWAGDDIYWPGRYLFLDR